MLLPIMLTVMVSKWVGDVFNISLYDLHVQLKCIPFVEASPPEELEHHVARDVMTTPVISVNERMPAGALLRCLQTTTHSGFPVVTEEMPHRCIGFILRNQITVLVREVATSPYPRDALSKLLPARRFASSLSSKRLPHRGISLNDEAAAKEIDLRPYMNPAPTCVQVSVLC